MKEAIKKMFGVEVQFRKGKGGSFEVYLDDALLYSKTETYRFPQNEEILALLKQHLENA